VREKYYWLAGIKNTVVFQIVTINSFRTFFSFCGTAANFHQSLELTPLDHHPVASSIVTVITDRDL
jgi:hypothetical protein